MQSASKIYIRAPAVFLAPLVLAVLMIGLGVWGTDRAAREVAKQDKDAALTGA